MWTKCENNPEIMVTEITARQTWTQSREGDRAVGGAGLGLTAAFIQILARKWRGGEGEEGGSGRLWGHEA